MKRTCCGLGLGLVLVAMCVVSAQAAPKRSLRVFAAASLLDAFKQIGDDFERANPGVVVHFQFAGSQTLAAQIEHGAEADVFAAADDRWMDYVGKRNFLAGPARTFAANRLVLVVPKANPARIRKVSDLARPGVRVIMGAESVPVGAYTRAALSGLSGNPEYGEDFGRRVVRNVVSQEENVRSIVSKVVLGEADAGFVYRSDVTHNSARHATLFELPKAAQVVARYPIAPLRGGREDLAQAFIAYVLSPAGQATLEKAMFTSAP